MRGFWYLLPAQVRSIISAWINGPVFPTVLQIEPTNRCNLKCIMCPHGCDKISEYRDLSFPILTKIIDEIYQYKYLRGVHIQGLGEPLLYPDLLNAIRFCKEKKLETYFNSNLTILSDEAAEELVKLQHDRIAVSIDSVDPDLYLWIRPGAKNHSLDRVLKNIEKLAEIKNKQNSKYPIIAVHAILLKSTIPQIPDMVRVLKDCGADMLCFQHLITIGIPDDRVLPNGKRLKDECAMDIPEEEKKEVLAMMRSLSSEGFEVMPPHDLDYYDEKLPPHEGIVTCFDLWEKPMVLSNGDFMPCCYTVGYHQFFMGNIYETDFQSIWFNDKYKELRWQHVSGKLNPVCAECSQLYQVAHPSIKLFLEGKIDNFQFYPNPFLGTQKYSFY